MSTKAALNPSKRAAQQTLNPRIAKGERPGPRHAENLASERMVDRVAELDAKALYWLARGRPANTEAGRAFRELKKIFHRKWMRHFKEKFEPRGITLRTAENYMKLAREADANIEKLSILKSASDQGAKDIRAATERAKTEFGGPARNKAGQERARLESPGLYRLPLHMSGDERDATDRLVKSPEWHRAEQEIVALIKQLHFDFGIVGMDSLPEVNNENADTQK
jgi:hypothetical protein